jgi:hypothetical protein
MRLVALLMLLGLEAAFASAEDESHPGEEAAEAAEEAASGASGGETTGRLMRTRVVRTKYGLVQGRVHKLDSDMLRQLNLKLPDVEVFQGIRYATPPVANNRFDTTHLYIQIKGITDRQQK